MEYWLNKKQALYITAKSDTPAAAMVTIQMVEVFDAFTSGKPIHVKEHARRPSTKMDKAISLARSADRLEAVADKLVPVLPNFCAMVIDGEPLIVDVNDFNIREGRAVVLTWDGDIAVMEADSNIVGHRFAGARSAVGPSVSNGRGSGRAGVVVVGKVVERQPIAAIPDSGKQIDLEPHYRGRKTLFRTKSCGWSIWDCQIAK